MERITLNGDDNNNNDKNKVKTFDVLLELIDIGIILVNLKFKVILLYY